MDDRTIREITACVVAVAYCLLCVAMDLRTPYTTLGGPLIGAWAARYVRNT